MTNIKHLTQIELWAYHNDTLEKTERQKVGNHLLNCADCRKQLPLPSVEQFWAAVMTDSDIIEEPGKEDARFSSNSIFSGFSAFLKLQTGLLWSGALLIIIFSFSFLLWLSLADSSREFVQTLENASDSEITFPLPETNPANKRQVSATNSNRVVANPTPKITKSEVPNQTKTKPEVPKPKLLQNNATNNVTKSNLRQKEYFSSARGVAVNCKEEKGIGIEFVTNKENFVFKWKKIPKAVKYHLYISDDEEILIDEFETEAETTFTLKKPLDSIKTYKWKIIVTLENGKTIVGASQKFTIKNFQTHQIKSEKRSNSDVRCQANQ